ncbi:MAG: HAD family hydrolase [Chloroflexi bacterium]|nr:HAD family hydrolase [Chloroflexota bacterium]MBL7061768.1 HAD family hydrolase [Dehalococcoidia bacterium]
MVDINEIKVVSFDAEGTLVTPDFSYAVWFEAIPECYAERHGVNFELARKVIEEEYQKLGDQRLEWYDVRYWFDKLGLGTPDQVMERCESKVRYYPEVKEVLASLSERYKLVVASGSMRDFLNHLLQDIEPYFTRIFSSLTDYKQLKTSEFYLKMCQAMEVKPSQVVHVGDNWQFDFVAPREVGIEAFYLDRKRQTNHQNSVASLLQLKIHLEG